MRVIKAGEDSTLAVFLICVSLQVSIESARSCSSLTDQIGGRQGSDSCVCEQRWLQLHPYQRKEPQRDELSRLAEEAPRAQCCCFTLCALTPHLAPRWRDGSGPAFLR